MDDPHPLRKWRDDNKVRLEDIAAALNVSPSFISMLERDKRSVSLETALKITDYTKGAIPPETFVGREIIA